MVICCHTYVVLLQAHLEDALKNAQEFDQGLQDFIAWLTTAEKTLTNTKAPSTIYDNVQKQIEDHRVRIVLVLRKCLKVVSVRDHQIWMKH